MTQLSWDEVGDKKFESGLDRGVLYLSDGTGVVWNGLVSVAEKTNVTVESLYFDGKKFNDVVTLGEYSATVSAFTYPEEFCAYEGIVDVGNGLNLFDQRLARFGMSYRTKFGDDIVGLGRGYKIHVVYNLLAAPSDVDNKTISDSPEPITFEWDVTAVPVDVAGYEPTAHLIIDTSKAPSTFVNSVEGYLYGNDVDDAHLPPMSYFMNLATLDW